MINNGAEPEDKDDAPAVAEWYAVAVTRWRTTSLAATDARGREERAAAEVERARAALHRAMTGGSNLPPIPPMFADRPSSRP